jgi:hypothetical protein
VHGAFEDLESGQRFDVVGDRVVVGCTHDESLTLGEELARADIMIAGGLAPHHFALRRDGERSLVEDLGSDAGTLVNDTRVDGEAPLRSGDVIRAGDRTLLFFDEAEERQWRRIGSWLAFAPLTGTARGWRALSMSPFDGSRRVDLVLTQRATLPEHPSVPPWQSHTRSNEGASVGVREEIAGASLARIVIATRHEGATLPEAAAVLILGEIAGALVGMRSLVDKPNVALGLNNIVVTWEGRVRVVAFSGHGTLPWWFAPAAGAIRRELTDNGVLHDVHMHALACVALELLGHDVRQRGTANTTVTGPLGAFARRCLRSHMNIDQARGELISIANEIGFYPGSELAALVRRLFAAEHAREMELREELALLDEDTAQSLVE